MAKTVARAVVGLVLVCGFVAVGLGRPGGLAAAAPGGWSGTIAYTGHAEAPGTDPAASEDKTSGSLTFTLTSTGGDQGQIPATVSGTTSYTIWTPSFDGCARRQRTGTATFSNTPGAFVEFQGGVAPQPMLAAVTLPDSAPVALDLAGEEMAPVDASNPAGPSHCVPAARTGLDFDHWTSATAGGCSILPLPIATFPEFAAAATISEARTYSTGSTYPFGVPCVSGQNKPELERFTLTVTPNLRRGGAAGAVPGTAAIPAQAPKAPASRLTLRQQASLAAVARGDRSVVPASVVTPAEAATGTKRVLVNVVLAGLLVMLLVFPAQLFNSTFAEHHGRIEGVLGRILPWRRRRMAVVGAKPARSAPVPLYLGLVVAGAVIAGFLDPHFGLHLRSVTFVVGVVVSGLVGSLLATAINGGYRKARRLPTDVMLKVLPAGLLVAVVCVAISRAVHFQPGYLYGLVGGVAFTTALDKRDDGRANFVAIVAAMAIALVAWVGFIPVSRAANHPHPGFVVLIADAVLASLFIGGIEGAFLGLVPLHFMPGHAVSRWSWSAWAVGAAVSAFLFVDVLLRPQSGYLGASSTASTLVTYGLFAGFGVGSVLFWAWFRLRPDQVDLGSILGNPIPSGRPIGADKRE